MSGVLKFNSPDDVGPSSDPHSDDVRWRLSILNQSPLIRVWARSRSARCTNHVPVTFSGTAHSAPAKGTGPSGGRHRCSETRGQHVVVVRRGETELFKTLQREFGHVPHVQVIWDRRGRERRAKRIEAPKTERRQHDRRARPPAMWEVQGYLLVRSES